MAIIFDACGEYFDSQFLRHAAKSCTVSIANLLSTAVVSTILTNYLPWLQNQDIQNSIIYSRENTPLTQKRIK